MQSNPNKLYSAYALTFNNCIPPKRTVRRRNNRSCLNLKKWSPLSLSSCQYVINSRSLLVVLYIQITWMNFIGDTHNIIIQFNSRLAAHIPPSERFPIRISFYSLPWSLFFLKYPCQLPLIIISHYTMLHNIAQIYWIFIVWIIILWSIERFEHCNCC